MATHSLRYGSGILSLASSLAVQAQVTQPQLLVPPIRQSDARADESGVSKPAWGLGVSSSVTFSDNIFLAPAGSERDGSTVEVSPYVVGIIDRPDRQAQLTYKLRNFYISPDLGYEGPRHDLRGSMNVALSGDWLWLAGEGSVYDVNTSPFGTSAADPASQLRNRSRYTSYEILPYARGRIGDSTDYGLGYGLKYLKYGDPPISSVTQDAWGRAIRNPYVGELGWQASFGISERRFEDDGEYDTRYATLGALYRPSGSVRLGVSADYARISVVSSASGRDGGWGPGLLLKWAPAERTTFDSRYSHAYYGDVGFARLSHRFFRWTLQVGYERSVEDGGVEALQSSGTSSPGPQELAPASAAISDSVDTRAGLGRRLSSSIVSGALVRARRMSITLDRQGVRSSMGIALFRARNESIATDVALPDVAGVPEDIEEKGGSLYLSHKLTQRSSANLNASFVRSKTPDLALKSDLAVLVASWTYDLSKRSAFGVAYRRAEQRGDLGDATEYKENALIASVDFRF